MHKRTAPCESVWAIKTLADGDRARQYAKRFESDGGHAAASYEDHVQVGFRKSKDHSKVRLSRENHLRSD